MISITALATLKPYYFYAKLVNNEKYLTYSFIILWYNVNPFEEFPNMLFLNKLINNLKIKIENYWKGYWRILPTLRYLWLLTLRIGAFPYCIVPYKLAGLGLALKLSGLWCNDLKFLSSIHLLGYCFSKAGVTAEIVLCGLIGPVFPRKLVYVRYIFLIL